MADEKTYTEDEHIGILTERVRRETADLSAEVETLQTTNTELGNKVDVLESAKAAAEQEAESVRTEFEAYKAGMEELREAASRKEDRVAKIREVASHLPDEWYEVEGRLERITAMDDDTFTGYVADLGSTNTVTPTGPVVPRETAMQGTPPANLGVTPSAGRNFLLRRYEKMEG